MSSRGIPCCSTPETRSRQLPRASTVKKPTPARWTL
jgi:hypothetical protein